MSELTVDQALQMALQYQQAGQVLEAEDICRQILSAYPDQGDALCLLGSIAHLGGRKDVAEEMIRKAVASHPKSSAYCQALGSLLQEQGRFDEAIKCFQDAIAADPKDAEALNHLGVLLSTAGRYGKSVEAFERVLALVPHHPAAQGSLGMALCNEGRNEEAARVFRKAIAQQPRVPAFHAGLGRALMQMRQLDEAVAVCHQALALDPGEGHAHLTLSMVYGEQRRDKEAIEEAKLAAAALPDAMDAQLNYGNCLSKGGRLDEAVTIYRKALERFPHSADLHNNLGNAFKNQANIDEALAEYRAAVKCRPGAAHFHGNYLYLLHFHPTLTQEAIFAEHRQFDEQHAIALRRETTEHTNDPTVGRRLRVGYVSGQFRGHVIGYNIFPVIANHDKSQLETFCYSDVADPDFLTYRFQQCADQWRNTYGKTDGQLAEMVRRDEIDILVDLNLHLEGSRLLAFARKPAPVQVSYAGYPATTGLSAIDYRLTDRHIEPEDAAGIPSSEIPVRLPDSFWCYYLQSEVAAVNTLPAKDLGYITFGNLNNFCKINEPTLELWAQVMRGVMRSRLLLLGSDGSHVRRTKAFFERHGIGEDRVEFVPRAMPDKYFRFYHRIDVGLDSFPYNGHNTSLDAFWMGVPVTTITGNTPVSRAGWCMLVNLGLPELAAKTPAEFVRLSTDLANNWPRLAELRAQMRARLQASSIMDYKRFARNVEEAYRGMWRQWCEKATASR